MFRSEENENVKQVTVNSNIIAKEAEAVDTLRKKLQMKKLESKQDNFGSNQGVVLRKNERSVFEYGNNLFNAEVSV